MKKLMVTMLFLSLLFSAQLIHAQDSELEGAILRLWATGADKKTEQILKNCSESSNQAVAAKARFHFSCMRIIKGEENASSILADLERTSQSSAEKEAILVLKEMLQSRSNSLPAGFQKKVSLDFRDVDVKEIVKIIAAQSNTNIVVHYSIKKPVSLALKNATIAQALDAICAIADMRYEDRNGVFVLLPSTSNYDKYVRTTYKPRSLSVEKAIKLLNSHASSGSGSKAPANFPADSQKIPQPAGLPAGLTINSEKDSIVLEGTPDAVEQYSNILENLDLKDKAHKISFRIWEMNPGNKTGIKEFSNLDEKGRSEIARIISAPAIISLPGKEAKITVGSYNKEKNEPAKDSIDYTISCLFNETDNPDNLQLSTTSSISENSVVAGKQMQSNKSRVAKIYIQRNKWVMLPLYEGKSLLYLEVQIARQQN